MYGVVFVTVVRSLCQQIQDDDNGCSYITYMILLEKEWKGKPRGWAGMARKMNVVGGCYIQPRKRKK